MFISVTVKSVWPFRNQGGWLQGRGVVDCLAFRPQAGRIPPLPCPAVPRPLLFFLGFCPVHTVIGPREGYGLAGALHRAWRQHPGLADPPQGPLPVPPAKLGPLLPARLKQGLEGHSGRPSVMLLLPW